MQNNIFITLKRALASFVDFGLLAVIVYLIIKFLGYDFEQVLASALVTNMVGFSLLFLIEATFISVWGTTPGMRLFSLEVKNADGSKLSLPKALLRSLLIFIEGSAVGLPFFGLLFIAWGINLLKLLITGTAFWDDQLSIAVVKKQSETATASK